MSAVLATVHAMRFVGHYTLRKSARPPVVTLLADNAPAVTFQGAAARAFFLCAPQKEGVALQEFLRGAHVALALSAEAHVAGDLPAPAPWGGS